MTRVVLAAGVGPQAVQVKLDRGGREAGELAVVQAAAGSAYQESSRMHAMMAATQVSWWSR
jgi:hypothetical protein